MRDQYSYILHFSNRVEHLVGCIRCDSFPKGIQIPGMDTDKIKRQLSYSGGRAIHSFDGYSWVVLCAKFSARF